MSKINRLWKLTIWHPAAIDPEEWESRSLRRFWLPLFDLTLAVAGLWAFTYGSPVLHVLFSEEVIDAAGLALTLSATMCLVGVVFPRLLNVELVGKIMLSALLGGYTLSVALFRLNPDPSAGFICFILVAAMMLPMYRLNLIGEQIKNNKDKKETVG